MSASLEDIFLWCDDTWCYREEIEYMGHMSDDFRIIYVDTEEYVEFCDNLGE